MERDGLQATHTQDQARMLMPQQLRKIFVVYDKRLT